MATILMYLHDQLAGIAFFSVVIIGVVVSIIWLLSLFGVGKSDSDEKVNFITSALKDEENE